MAFLRLLVDGHERGQLHEQEREIALLPAVAPALNHGREQRPILVGPAGVRFALVPDGPGDGIGLQGGDHAVVEGGRRSGGAAGFGRQRGGSRQVLVGRVKLAGRFQVLFQRGQVLIDALGIVLDGGVQVGDLPLNSGWPARAWRVVHGSAAVPPQEV